MLSSAVSVAHVASDQLRGEPHGVAQLEAEDVAVEVQRLRVVPGGQHHVAKALMLRDESVAVGTDHPAVLERGTVEHLEGVARRVLKDDHPVDAAVDSMSKSIALSE